MSMTKEDKNKIILIIKEYYVRQKFDKDYSFVFSLRLALAGSKLEKDKQLRFANCLRRLADFSQSCFSLGTEREIQDCHEHSYTALYSLLASGIVNIKALARDIDCIDLTFRSHFFEEILKALLKGSYLKATRILISFLYHFDTNFIKNLETKLAKETAEGEEA